MAPGGGAVDRAILRWKVCCLGPTSLLDESSGEHVALSPLQRRLLAVLALRPRRTVSVDVLVDAMWPDRTPATARASLHNQVSSLRARMGADAIVSSSYGYSLATATDVEEFEAACLRRASPRGTRLPSRSATIDAALALWRGEPFADVEHLTEATTAAVRLGAIRRNVRTEQVRILLADGGVDRAIAAAQQLVGEHPTDEDCWALFASALADGGRRGDALAAVSRATRILRDQLGVSPGPELQDLHRRLVAAPAAHRRIDALRPTGREDVVARIVSLLDRGHSVVIAGEDGVGRTTVAREVWRALRRGGTQCVFATAEPTAASPTELLDDVLDELGLPRIAGVDAVDTFVRRIAEEGPTHRTVLVVDDLGHAGPSSLAAIDRCLRVPTIQLVATVALHDGVPPLLARHHLEVLEPLADSAVRAIVREAGVLRGIDHDREEALVALSGGNPLLLGHLLDEPWILDPGDTAPARDMIGVSEGLAAAVDRLVAPHGAAVRRAIDVASVIGRTGPFEVWRLLSSPTGVDGALASGLVERRHDEFRFRHGATARVRAASLAPGLRMEIQRAYADTCRAAGLPVLTYATHSWESRALDARTAYDDCMHAGRDSTERGMHGDAGHWYGLARIVAQQHLSDDAAAALRARTRCGDAMRLCGDPLHVPELLACAGEALHTGDPELVTESAYALLQFGGTSQQGDAQRRAMRHADRALLALEGDERWALVAAATTLTVSLFHGSDTPRRLFERALTIARDPELRRKILPYAYMTFGHPSDVDRRVQTADELLHLAREAGDPSALFSAHHQHWANALVHGDVDGIALHHEAMEVLVERIGTVGARWETMSSLTALLIARGELAEAEHMAHATHDLLAPVMAERAAAVLVSQLFAIRRHQGRLDELEPVLRTVVARQPSVGALRALWSATLLGTNRERALHEAIAASRSVHRDFTWLPAQFVVGEVVAAARAAEHAPRMLALLSPWAHLHAAPLTCIFGPVRDVVQALGRIPAAAR